MSRTTDIAEVRETVAKYIKASATADVALMKSIFHKDAIMMGALGDNYMEGTPEPFFKMLEDGEPLSKSDSDSESGYHAEIVDIQVFGKAAIATISEEGFYGMGFVDSFHLLKKEQGWLITSKIFNRD